MLPLKTAPVTVNTAPLSAPLLKSSRIGFSPLWWSTPTAAVKRAGLTAVEATAPVASFVVTAVVAMVAIVVEATAVAELVVIAAAKACTTAGVTEQCPCHTGSDTAPAWSNMVSAADGVTTALSSTAGVPKAPRELLLSSGLLLSSFPLTNVGRGVPLAPDRALLTEVICGAGGASRDRGNMPRGRR